MTDNEKFGAAVSGALDGLTWDDDLKAQLVKAIDFAQALLPALKVFAGDRITGVVAAVLQACEDFLKPPAT